MSAPADLLAFHLTASKIPFVRELRFCPERRWRADFCVGDKILVEVSGGVYSGGRHVRGAGYTRDCEKQNAAVLLGYIPLVFTTEHVKSGYALETIEKALGLATT